MEQPHPPNQQPEQDPPLEVDEVDEVDSGLAMALRLLEDSESRSQQIQEPLIHDNNQQMDLPRFSDIELQTLEQDKAELDRRIAALYEINEINEIKASVEIPKQKETDPTTVWDDWTKIREKNEMLKVRGHKNTSEIILIPQSDTLGQSSNLTKVVKSTYPVVQPLADIVWTTPFIRSLTLFLVGVLISYYYYKKK